MTYTEIIVQNMELYFPWMTEKMVNYKIDSFHPYEAVVTLTDGSVYLYDDVDKTVRKLPSTNEAMTKNDVLCEFGKRLEKILYRKGVTQGELSERTGIAQPILSGYINGKHEPGFHTVDKIARALGCSADEFRYI